MRLYVEAEVTRRPLAEHLASPIPSVVEVEAETATDALLIASQMVAARLDKDGAVLTRVRLR